MSNYASFPHPPTSPSDYLFLHFLVLIVLFYFKIKRKLKKRKEINTCTLPEIDSIQNVRKSNVHHPNPPPSSFSHHQPEHPSHLSLPPHDAALPYPPTLFPWRHGAPSQAPHFPPLRHTVHSLPHSLQRDLPTTATVPERARAAAVV